MHYYIGFKSFHIAHIDIYSILFWEIVVRFDNQMNDIFCHTCFSKRWYRDCFSIHSNICSLSHNIFFKCFCITQHAVCTSLNYLEQTYIYMVSWKYEQMFFLYISWILNYSLQVLIWVRELVCMQWVDYMRVCYLF